MAKNAEIWNLSEPSEKHRLMRQISSLPAGLYEVLIAPKRRTRSLDQNAYLHVALITPFAEWLREQYGDPNISLDQAREMLAVKILGLQYGVLVPRTSTLSTEEFSAFIDAAAKWLQDFCEITAVPSDLFYEMKGKK